MPYGIDDLEWDELLRHATEVLTEVARGRGMITYGDLSRMLARRVPSTPLDPHYGPMPHLLDEVNRHVRERQPDAPLLTALVVGADTNRPGGGFFKLAEDLGYSVVDRDVFWAGQVEACHDWARSRRR